MIACLATPPEFVRHEGEVIGVFLGNDRCVEHEFGIRSIQIAFGCGADPSALGLDRHRITVVPETFQRHVWEDGTTGIIFGRRYVQDSARLLGHELKFGFVGYEVKLTKTGVPYKNGARVAKYRDIAAAWSSSAFGVRVTGDHSQEISNLHAAMKDLDAVVLVGREHYNRSPIIKYGLSINIFSKIPQDLKDRMRKEDQEAREVDQWVKSTGIVQRLKEAGRGWYAFTPSRFPNGLTTFRGRVAEAGEVAFCINPTEQRKYNSGWFNLGELEQWAQGTGPVIKERGVT